MAVYLAIFCWLPASVFLLSVYVALSPPSASAAVSPWLYTPAKLLSALLALIYLVVVK
jgi:hypothetical protein